MQNLLFIFIIAASLSSCSSKTTCNKILDAAKEGQLYITLPNTQLITAKYWHYFTKNPSKYIDTTYTDNIFIPQFFDSYRFISANEITFDTLHATMDLKLFGKSGDEGYESMKKYAMEKDMNAWIKDEVVFYADGLVETQRLDYLIVKGNIRFKQTFLCAKKEKEWLIYMAIFREV